MKSAAKKITQRYKKFRQTKWFVPIGLIVFALLFGSSVIMVKSAIDTWETGFQVGTETKNIYYTSSETCQKVTNTSGNTYFIPTKTEAEWSSFSGNPPANITIGECCTDDPLCVGKYEGEIICTSATTRGQCTDNNSDGCLELVPWGLCFGCSGGACTPNSCWFTQCYSNDVWCYNETGQLDHLYQDCVVYNSTYYDTGSCCAQEYRNCSSGGTLQDRYLVNCNSRDYTGTCSGAQCEYVDGPVNCCYYPGGTCGFDQHIVVTPAGCYCAAGAPDCP